VNAQNSAGSTPLHEAALVGDWPLVRMLVSRGANPNVGNRKKETPLDVANAHKRSEVVSVLQNEVPAGKSK
jgi:ankyrin repeat protein